MVIEYGSFQINISIFANVFVFHAFGLSLHPHCDTHIFGHCIIFSVKEGHRPQSVKVPIPLMLIDLLHAITCDLVLKP